MASLSARTLKPEDQISHYKIVGPLGAGGMGEVYLARDESLERNVALKILPPNLVRSEDRLRRFVLEAKSASSLSHPNIVTIYEIGQESVLAPGEPDSDPVHFISMELVSGKTLSTLIHEDQTDLRTLLGYLAQAADGLAKAHAAGIVHRDLKPGNIMVTADGFAKVLDFGLAKLTEKHEVSPEASSAPTIMAGASTTGMVVGTAGYMSPEQIQGKSVDHRSDIFSFGCILYEAATRQRPFLAETGVETMHKILNEKPAPVEELNDKAPAELRRLIRRCLAKSADQRLQSMKDLAIELREIVDEYETLSASASSGSISSGAVAVSPRRRVSRAVWIAVALVAIGGAAFAWWAMQRGGPVTQPFQTMRLTTQTNRGDVTDAVLSPDGRFLAYLADKGGKTGLRVRQVATGSDVEVVPVADLEIHDPAFSPDGNYLFYSAVKADNRNYRVLYQIPSLGGPPRERAFDVDSRASFSPDGKQFVFWRGVPNANENRLIAFDLAGGKERVVASVGREESFADGPSWSPDGKRIAGALVRTAPQIQSTIVMFDPATGRRQDFTTLGNFALTSIAWLRDGSGIVSTGQDLASVGRVQILLTTYPRAHSAPVTNDFSRYSGVSASMADETIAAVRTTVMSNLWLADAAGAPARRLTSVVNPENSPFAGMALDSASVLYSAPQDRTLQVWTLSLASGETRPLTSGDAHSFRSLRLRDGVAFNRLDSAIVHLWRMNADGSGLRQLTAGKGEQSIGVSGDGLHVLHMRFDSPGSCSIVSAEDGRVELELPDVRGAPRFSPDSRSLAYGKFETDSRGLISTAWVIAPIAGGPASATVRLPDGAAGIRWSPDGKGLTFLNRADPAWNVQLQPLEGRAPRVVTHFTEGRVSAHEWSPDGRKLALQVQTGEATNLWVVEADGSRPVQVTSFTSETVFGYEWLPDSRRLLLGAGTSSSDAVLIRDFR